MMRNVIKMQSDKVTPIGYKLTEVGIIPKDWDVFLLGEIFDFKNGLNKGKEYFGYGTPIINYMDVYMSGGIHSSSVKGKVSVTQAEKKNYSARKGDVFFTRTSETIEEIGFSSVLLDEIKDTVFSGFVLRGRQKNDVFIANFMKYCFRTEQLRKQIKNTASYTTRALTNGSLLSKVFVPAPNKVEQLAIANALSDVDVLISNLEQLNAKKQSIKTATIQQLLTGRNRLPLFDKHIDSPPKGYKSSELGLIPEDWDVHPLGHFLNDSPRYGINAPAVKLVGNIPVYIRITDISDDGYFRPTEKAGVNNQFSDFYILQDGDLVLARTGASVGKSYLYKPEDGTLVYAGFLIKITPNQRSLNSKFLFQYLKTQQYWNWIATNSMRSGQPGVNGNEFASLPIPVPPIKEQTAIGTILSDMDAEIATLEQKLAKVRDIKQGMMQQLLTGRIRLPLEQYA